MSKPSARSHDRRTLALTLLLGSGPAYLVATVRPVLCAGVAAGDCGASGPPAIVRAPLTVLVITGLVFAFAYALASLAVFVYDNHRSRRTAR